MVASGAHVPVLLDAVLAGLAMRPDGHYVDATFGRGGHSAAMIERLNSQGRLLAMDRDPEAVAAARQRYADDSRVTVTKASFSLLAQAVETAGMMGQVHGVLLDLGVSSPQFDNPERGFSFTHDGPLDMRMDPDAGEPVSEWLMRAEEAEIKRLLRDYGDETHAGRIARAIVRAREQQPITRTHELADIISAAVPKRFHEPGRHPATRAFQALRIFINRELDELRAILPQTLDVLAAGGRLVVISFHSLEDRIVKRFLREASRGDPYPIDLPVPADALQPQLKLVGGVHRPTPAEVDENPRARSAVLRVAERCAA